MIFIDFNEKNRLIYKPVDFEYIFYRNQVFLIIFKWNEMT